MNKALDIHPVLTPSMAEDGGCEVKSMWPTADVLLPSISCSLTMLGVRQTIWIDQMGGLQDSKSRQAISETVPAICSEKVPLPIL